MAAPAAPVRLQAVDLAALVRGPVTAGDPVLRVVLERARTGSQPGTRDDDHVVCLAIEGGGMRGAVSAGMCLVLEAAGLTPAFDRIYGVSAGALNGAALAMGQSALSATHYEDAATRRVIHPARPLVGRPVVDLDLLFEDVIAARKPLAFAALRRGPEFRAVATSLTTGEAAVLRDFADLDELMLAVRASAALPRLAGGLPSFRGTPMADGGLVEAIPYERALREGATHVLVLRSRPSGWRKPSLSSRAERMALRGAPALRAIAAAHDGGYNRLAAALQHADDARVTQIAVPDGARLIGRLESSRERVVEALRLGAAAMADAVLERSIELCWQPVAYAALPLPVPAAAPALPARRRLPALRRAAA